MHNNLPKIFIFLDKINNKLSNYNNTNIGIIYRNYHSKKRYKNLIPIAKICKQKKFKLFVSNDINLAIKFKADGIYIPSFNKKRTNYLNIRKKNLIILGSAHSQKEIFEKEKQHCKMIFLSPIFKKNKKDLGILKFNLLTRKNKLKFYALGGINHKTINKTKLLNVIGFAGKSLLQKKTGLKLGRFLIN